MTVFSHLHKNLCLSKSCLYTNTVAETWRRVLGGRKMFGGPRFLHDVFFGKNFHFHGKNL